MNVIVRLQYELAYYDSAVHSFNHYTARAFEFIWFVAFLYFSSEICGNGEVRELYFFFYLINYISSNLDEIVWSIFISKSDLILCLIVQDILCVQQRLFLSKVKFKCSKITYLEFRVLMMTYADVRESVGISWKQCESVPACSHWERPLRWRPTAASSWVTFPCWEAEEMLSGVSEDNTALYGQEKKK